MEDAEKFMRRALELAKRGWGATSPNPMVGAVLVKDGRIIGEGWHTKDGAAHAEIECLRSSAESPIGADLYVTLEPCSTHGRTGACCDAIAAAKIARVFVGTSDPNPEHAGRAKQVLNSHGIECSIGILEEQCRSLNFIFNETIVAKTAAIALKYAQSADGKITAVRGKPTPITGESARADVMKWRKLFQAIGVGRGTLEADNPSLTSRIEGEPVKCPLRLIFDSRLKLADDKSLKRYKVFADEFADRTIIVCDSFAEAEREKSLADDSIKILRIASNASSPEFWRLLKNTLWKKRIASLYLEGGAEILRSCASAKAAEFAFEYRNNSLVLDERALPLWLGQRPFDFENPRKFSFGNDAMTFGKIYYK